MDELANGQIPCVLERARPDRRVDAFVPRAVRAAAGRAMPRRPQPSQPYAPAAEPWRNRPPGIRPWQDGRPYDQLAMGDDLSPPPNRPSSATSATTLRSSPELDLGVQAATKSTASAHDHLVADHGRRIMILSLPRGRRVDGAEISALSCSHFPREWHERAGGSARPAMPKNTSVGLTGRVVRRSSVTPSIRSRSATWRLTAVVDMLSLCAALEKLPARATSTKTVMDACGFMAAIPISGINNPQISILSTRLEIVSLPSSRVRTMEAVMAHALRTFRTAGLPDAVLRFVGCPTLAARYASARAGRGP